MKPILPEAALHQHVAVLGKTRSGKSSVLRLLVEGILEREIIERYTPRLAVSPQTGA